MWDAPSLGVVLSVKALGSFVFNHFKSKAKEFAEDRVERAIAEIVRRFGEGSVPARAELDGALRKSLGQAARVLAYQLHDPGRRRLGELLENFSDWPNLAHRLLEITQDNLLAGNATDHWLATLIDASKAPGNFADLPLDLVLEDHQVTRLLEDNSDPALRAAVHDRFLAWVERHVPDNGGKPAGFAQAVREGTPVGTAGARLAFYDLVCVFFREHLKDDPVVFRAFTASVLTGLQGDLAEIRAALPDAATLQRFTDALAAFEEKEFNVSYARFKQHLHRQNEQVLALPRREFAAVHEHLDRQDRTLAAVRDTTHAHRREAATGHGLLRRRLGWVLGALTLVAVVLEGGFWWQHRSLARLEALVKRDATGSQLLQEFRQRLEAARFSTQTPDPEATVNTVLAELARDRQLTVDELRQRLLQAAANAEERLALTGQLRRATEQEGQRLRVIERDAHVELAAVAELAGQLPNALSHYQQALALADRATEPQIWASFQHSLAEVHYNLGVKIEGKTVREHLQSAVTAYRAALEVRTRAELPQDWAATQNNLGIALRAQAGRSEGGEAVRLLGEAVTAYRAALEVYTRAELPQGWATTQNNLGIALRAQAGRSEGDAAVRLLGEAVAAFQAALTVFTPEFHPNYHGVVKRNLARAEADLAKLQGQSPP